MTDTPLKPEQIVQSLAKQSESLAALERGWDGYDAAPLDRGFISRFIAQIESEGALVDVVPGADGSLQAEWHVSGVVDVEYDERPNGERSIYVSVRPTPTSAENARVAQEPVAFMYDPTVLRLNTGDDPHDMVEDSVGISVFTADQLDAAVKAERDWLLRVIREERAEWDEALEPGEPLRFVREVLAELADAIRARGE